MFPLCFIILFAGSGVYAVSVAGVLAGLLPLLVKGVYCTKSEQGMYRTSSFRKP